MFRVRWAFIELSCWRCLPTTFAKDYVLVRVSEVKTRLRFNFDLTLSSGRGTNAGFRGRVFRGDC